ncbi:cation transport protein-domain-containing protein [Hyaloraphidium curvatum]|nr:cation transport protein-domain-containing protein [Hyaloraphidium curvatum]
MANVLPGARKQCMGNVRQQRRASRDYNICTDWLWMKDADPKSGHMERDPPSSPSDDLPSFANDFALDTIAAADDGVPEPEPEPDPGPAAENGIGTSPAPLGAPALGSILKPVDARGYQQSPSGTSNGRNRPPSITSTASTNSVDASNASKLYHLFWEIATFRLMHVTFFVFMLFLFSGLLMISAQSLNYIDALFLAASSLTGSGLSTVPMESLNDYQQSVLFFSLKAAVDYLEHKREAALAKSLEDAKKESAPREASVGPEKLGNGERTLRKARTEPVDTLRRRRSTWAQPPGWPRAAAGPGAKPSPLMATSIMISAPAQGGASKVTFAEPARPPRAPTRPPPFEYVVHPSSGALVRRKTYAAPSSAASAAGPGDLERGPTAETSETSMTAWAPRKLPAAIPELDALTLLSIFVPLYQLVPPVLCSAISVIWLAFSPGFRDTIQNAGAAAWPVSPPRQSNAYWFGIFMCFSAFTNCGLSTVSAGATIFLNGAGGPIPYLLVALTYAGFTLSPVFIRYIVLLMRWIEAKRLRRKGHDDAWGQRRKTVATVPSKEDLQHHEADHRKSSRFLDALDFLLEHPRRVYTLMFRTYETRWILFVNLGFTILGFILYLSLDWNRYLELGFVRHGWSFWFDGFFQEANTRNTGMAIFDLNLLNPGMLIYFIVGMYLAIFPIALVRRKTNVYLEQDLMVGSRPEGLGSRFRRWIGSIPDERTKKEWHADVYMLTRLKAQMFSDLGFVIVAIFLIVAIECSRDLDPPIPVFSAIFEVVSAFGNVGLSLGYPGVAASLSAVFTPAGKLIMTIVFMVGRHRGLPDNVDKSVQIPGVAEVVEAAGLWKAMEPSARSDSDSESEGHLGDGDEDAQDEDQVAPV